MADSTHQQVWDALKSLLAGIVSDGGTTYWYTPEAVVEFPAFSEQCLNTEKTVVYVLAPDEESEDVDGFTYQRTRVTEQIRLTVAQKFAPDTENPFDPPSPNRLEVMDRMLRDAEKKLNSDWTLAGLALRVAVVRRDRSAARTYFQGWAVAHLTLRAEYEYDDDAP